PPNGCSRPFAGRASTILSARGAHHGWWCRNLLRGTAGAATKSMAVSASVDRVPLAGALVCGGVTCSGEALVSQCAPEAPIGVTFREKALRYQRTAQSVLNPAVLARIFCCLPQNRKPGWRPGSQIPR